MVLEKSSEIWYAFVSILSKTYALYIFIISIYFMPLLCMVSIVVIPWHGILARIECFSYCA
jgi:hypothetical protein